MADDRAAPAPRFEPVKRHTALALLALVLLFNLPLLHYYLFRSPPPAPRSVPWTDDFSDPGTVQKNYWSSGALWRVQNGELFGPGPKASVLWLTAKLPHDVAVDVDVRSPVPGSDAQVHLFGNGTDWGSGYVVTGGAGGGGAFAIGRLGTYDAPTAAQRVATARQAGSTANTLDELAKEGRLLPSTSWHTDVMAQATGPNQRVHWHVERVGAELRWFIDGKLVSRTSDPVPLEGPGHDRVGLSGWEADVFYDNLKVTPITGFSAEAAPAPPPALAAPASTASSADGFSDGFDRPTLGDDYSGLAVQQAQLVDGHLRLSMMHNRPLWLKRPLPDNARIDFKARSLSPDGDLKIEAWGDGVSGYSGDLRLAYTATGYVFILGGWRNTISALAKQHEHTPDRKERSDFHLEPGRWYQWTIEKRGNTVRWFIDGQPFLAREDAESLQGPGHDHLGFSGWETTVEFDDLKVTPL